VSMWDAALLLFVQRNSAKDVAVLSAGLLLNLALQGLVFWVIVRNMLKNPYDANMVGEMIQWRVDKGQDGDEFDAKTGDSLAARLCRGMLWSYEGAAYKDMYRYLYKPIPGQVLSLLAIILWVLNTMTEFRHSLEQAQAVLLLPTIPRHACGVKQTDDGEFQTVGIYRGRKFLACVVLLLPRLVIIIGITFAGCRYLAQTVILSDIILNAVALAFVMDIDEQLAEFFLPNRLRHVSSHMEPLSCGRQNYRVGLNLRDTCRYVLALGIVLFATFFWLLPFSSNVEGAATALCGGDLDFSYTGGRGRDLNLTLMPTVDTQPFQPTCDARTNWTYQRRYYPDLRSADLTLPSHAEARPATSQNASGRRHEVLRYAFRSSDCPRGQVRSPPKADAMEGSFFEAIFGSQDRGARLSGGSTYSRGRCAGIPTSLAGTLQPGMERGHTFPDCPRFNASLGAAACAEQRHPGVCLWSWEAQACEGLAAPGRIFRSACRSDLWLECRTWEAASEAHPTRNCEVARRCTPGFPRCLAISGWLDLTVSNASELLESAPELERALEKASGVFGLAEPWTEAAYKLFFFGAGRRPLRAAPEVELAGVLDASHGAPAAEPNDGKAVHFRAVRDIANLSVYGLGTANNGRGTDGVEFVLPPMPVPAGAHILVSRNPAWFASYLGSCASAFHAILQGDEPSGNGNDAVELFRSGAAFDTLGSPNVDGTGSAWEYTGAWAYRDSSGSWTTGRPYCAATANTTQASDCPYPLCVRAPRSCSSYRCPPLYDPKPNSWSIAAWDLESCCDLQARCSSFTQECPPPCVWSGIACVDQTKGCKDERANCVMVYWSYLGVSEYLRTQDILNSSDLLAETLNRHLGRSGAVLSASFNSSSIDMSLLPDVG